MVAIIEPILLLHAPKKPAGFAAVVLGIQALGALVAFGFALRRTPPPPESDRLARPPDLADTARASAGVGSP